MREASFSEAPKVNSSLRGLANISEENMAQNRREERQAKKEMQSQHFQPYNEVVMGRRLLELLVIYQMDQMGFERREYEKYVLTQIADRYEQEQKHQLHKISSEIVQAILVLMDNNPQTANVNPPRFGGPNRRFSSLYAALKTLPMWSARLDRRPSLSERAHSEQAPNINKEMAQLDEPDLGRPSQQIIHENSAPMGPEIMCSICCSMCSSWSEDACQHPFCNNCITSYITELINVGKYSIKCPEQNCNTILADKNIATHIKQEEYDRFIYFRDKIEKENNPDNKFCARPDCGEVLMQQTGDRYICVKCKVSFCGVCMQEWHEGRCDEALKNAIELTYSKLKIKKCPNCNAPIEKSEGCNHMNCKKCDKEFCWLCLGSYSRYHYKYYNCFGCPGMQFEGEGSIIKERVKQMLFFLICPIIFALFLLLFFIVMPFYMIGCIFGKTCTWAQSEEKWESVLVNKLFFWLPQCLNFLLKWVFLLPRGVLYGVFVAPVILSISFWGSLAQMVE